MTRPPFELSKWYFDCVAPDGRTFIGYAGDLRWKSLSLQYQSSSQHFEGEGTHTRFSLRNVRPPSITSEAVHWQSPPLQVDGTWKAMEPPVRATILQTDSSAIEWHCVQPRASAYVRIGNAAALCGLGYVEHLRMTLPPWRLPLKELRWGRFLGETHSLVWIDWQGPYSTRLVFHNGVSVQAERITERQVVLVGGTTVLEFENNSVLREGTLGKTALSKIPNVQKFFPRSLLRIRECKWISRAVLQCAGTADASGWAIHEVVQWP